MSHPLRVELRQSLAREWKMEITGFLEMANGAQARGLSVSMEAVPEADPVRDTESEAAGRTGISNTAEPHLEPCFE